MDHLSTNPSRLSLTAWRTSVFGGSISTAKAAKECPSLPWCPRRFSAELNSVVNAAAASLWLNPGLHVMRRMLALGCRRVFESNDVSPLVSLAAASQKYQYGGY